MEIVHTAEKRILEAIRLLTVISQSLSFSRCCSGSIQPTTRLFNTEEILFGLPNTPNDELKRKLNYTILYMCYYIYNMKLQNDSLLISDFISKIIYKYRIEQLL